jgi:hypothetical protein
MHEHKAISLAPNASYHEPWRQQPVSSIQNSVSSIEHPETSIKDPASSASIKDPASSASIKHPVSRIQYPVLSSLDNQFQLI